MTRLLRAGEVAKEAGVSPKALRGYESLGLLEPSRGDNGYRLYDDHQVKVVSEIRKLNALGISLRDMAPFVNCLNAGSDHADSCPSTLREYRHTIDRIDRNIASLTSQRDALVANLSAASSRLIGEMAVADAANDDLAPLPRNLPVPEDDGAVDHLPGMRLPSSVLPSTDGDIIDVAQLGAGRTLVYVFPMTGSPEIDMPDGWDTIPGARGCSPQNCDMRNHYADLMQKGVRRIFGLSSQPIAYQQSLVSALQLPYPLLTDERLELAEKMGLPTLSAGQLVVYQRFSLLIHDGVIEHVFYPVFPPDQHASVVLEWLENHPRSGTS